MSSTVHVFPLSLGCKFPLMHILRVGKCLRGQVFYVPERKYTRSLTQPQTAHSLDDSNHIE